MSIVTITPGSWQEVVATTADTAIQNRSQRPLFITTEDTTALPLTDGLLLPPWKAIVVSAAALVSGSVLGGNADVFYMAMGADSTAPVLTSPVDAANGATAATGSVTTNEGAGTLYWVVTTSTTAPTEAQVKLGQDHTGSAGTDAGSQAVAATGVQTLSPAPSGLTASTFYVIHYMHEDTFTNQSNVASGDGFTTTA